MLFTKADIGVSTDNQNEKAEQCSAFTSKFLNVQAYKVEKLSADLVKLPDPGEAYFLQTLAQFNAFTFVEWISRLQYIEELWATTYSISVRVVEALQELQRLGKIGRIRVLVSDSMMKRNPKVCDTINAWAQGNDQVTVIYTWNHSKVTLLKTADNYFCIEGSGNWGDNAAYEQYCMINDEAVFRLRTEIFYDCKVVHKIN